MKILIVQLARLGDIYQTWPTLKALKRTHPGAELHLLTRTKFAAAAPEKKWLDHHWLLNTREVLSPLVDEIPKIDESIDRLGVFCSQLKAEKFDLIINLSFSPFSSYLTAEITTPGLTRVAGYTRFSDGFLNIPDDGSAYFYAQVGVGKSNRFHITDLFAHVAGVELIESDWEFRQQDQTRITETSEAVGVNNPHETDKKSKADGDQSILIHIGASTLGKTLSWSKWLQVVKGLIASSWCGSIVLIGSAEEVEIADKIVLAFGDRKPVNLVGQTTLHEVFAMVGEADLLIGGDSAPVQMASLLQTPVLNLSFPMVRFWETGPRSKKSRILTIESEQSIAASEIVDEALGILQGHPMRYAGVRVVGPTMPYIEMRPQEQEFEWELLRAMYVGENYPVSPSELFLLAMKRLDEINFLALEQFETLRKNVRNKTASDILDRTDELMDQLTQMVPAAEVMIRWFRTERVRIGPLPFEELINKTELVHRNFAHVIALYSGSQESETKGQQQDSIGAVKKGDVGDNIILG